MPTWLSAFLRTYQRVIALVVIAGCLVVPLARALRSTPDYDDTPDGRYTASLIAAHTRDRNREHDQRVIAEHNLVVVKQDAARARVAYWAARSSVTRQVAALPGATITGDTLTIQNVPYVVPHPVAVAWAARDTVLVAMQDALTKGDHAVVSTVREVAATDSVASHAVKEADAATALAADETTRAEGFKAQQPGVLARLRGALFGSTKVLAAAALGYGLAKVLP